ncbi:MAG: hypothetical protein RSE91_04955, partial [Bacilli bacterium]
TADKKHLIKKDIIQECSVETISKITTDTDINKAQTLTSDDIQIDFTFMEKESFIKELSTVDILSLNPMEAMNKLYKLVSDAKKLI